jgi:hypothetical protein
VKIAAEIYIFGIKYCNYVTGGGAAAAAAAAADDDDEVSLLKTLLLMSYNSFVEHNLFLDCKMQNSCA